MAVCGIVALLLSFRTSPVPAHLPTFMEGSNQRMQLLGLDAGRGYLNIPVIGSLNATVNSSSLGIGILWTLLRTVMIATIS